MTEKASPTVLSVKRLATTPLPSYAHPGDAGFDLRAVDAILLAPGERKLVRTGIALELPVSTEGQVRSRSGLAVAHGVVVLNAPGTIDAGYRGEVKVLLANLGTETFSAPAGTAIAQLEVAPVLRPVIEEAS